MLSKLTSHPPALIFIDTLYHFQETLDLKDKVASRYNVPVNVYQPSGASNAAEFEALYGERLWETNDAVYDFWAKVCLGCLIACVLAPLSERTTAKRSLLFIQVEPAQRAYAELGVKSIITGRRASQGAARSTLQPLEIDSTGLLKLNPFFSWSFAQVKAYIDENKVPVNKLLSQGYKSVGGLAFDRKER